MKFKIVGGIELIPEDDNDDGSGVLELIVEYKGRDIPAWVKIDIEKEQKKKDIRHFLNDLDNLSRFNSIYGIKEYIITLEDKWKREKNEIG